MGILQTALNKTANASVSGYPIALVGDGTSLSVTVDIFGLIAADPAVANKSPTGIAAADDDRGNSTVSGTMTATLSGTYVTLTWPSTPVAAGGFFSVGIQPTFNP